MLTVGGMRPASDPAPTTRGLDSVLAGVMELGLYRGVGGTQLYGPPGWLFDALVTSWEASRTSGEWEKNEKTSSSSTRAALLSLVEAVSVLAGGPLFHWVSHISREGAKRVV